MITSIDELVGIVLAIDMAHHQLSEEVVMPEWLLDAFTVLTPTLVALFGFVIARQNRTAAKRQAMEQQMRADRVQVYRDVLEPFLLMFTPDAVWKREQMSNPEYKGKTKEDVIQDKMLSVHWTTQAMHMALIGSDAVVSAFINLLSYARNTPEQDQSQTGPSPELPVELMRHMAIFLREVRKSTGNEDTALRHWDMLRVVVTDLVPALEASGVSADEIRPSRRRPLKDSELRR